MRGYTTGAAYAAFLEDKTGSLAKGTWADITVVDMDVLNIGISDPAKLFDGNVLMTIVGGRIVYKKE